MTNSHNLESLIRQHEALKAFALEVAFSVFVGNDYLKAKTLMSLKAQVRELLAELGIEAPAAEVEAIAPKYAVGDKVRVKVDFERGNYRAGEYEVITAIRDFVPKPLDDARCIKLAFPCNDRFDDNEDWEWRADELIPYTDTD